MRVAIGIWGILRACELTYPSFVRYILSPLEKANFAYDIIMHTYSLEGMFTNVRTKEMGIRINESQWKIYEPNYIYIEDQDEFDLHVNSLIYEKQGDPWKNHFSSFQNELRALNSLFHITSVIERLLWIDPSYYDAILFVRPDVKFLNPLPIITITRIIELDSRTLFVPDFHRSCRMEEINDRFAIGSVAAGLTYGKRLEYALLYSQQHKLHSEKYLYYYLFQLKKLTVVEIPLRFQRIRANRVVEKRDTSVVSPSVQIARDKEADFLTFTSKSSRSVLYMLFSWITYPWLLGVRLVEGYSFHCRPLKYIDYKEILNHEQKYQRRKKISDCKNSRRAKINCHYRQKHFFLQSDSILKLSVIKIPDNCTTSFL